MLELKDITRIYRGQPAVRDVTLTAPAGGRTVIVGPSGSGKTTLLRLIAGFEAPDRGERRPASSFPRICAGWPMCHRRAHFSPI